MNDRELLELAAKAAGWPVTGLAPLYMCAHGSDLALIIRNDRGGESVWNPLADDGDALRLAVKLGILVDLRYTSPETARYNSVTYWPNPMKGERIEFGDREMDPYAATRRAIVRVAAEIGRTK